MGMWQAWGGRGAYSGLVGRPKYKKPLGRNGHFWEDSINVDLKKYATVWTRFDSR
jgi:hypothetical protein